jgi:folate-binding protein YgfZ
MPDPQPQFHPEPTRAADGASLVLRWGDEGAAGIDVVGAYDSVEVEYAWLRTRGVLVDWPQRAVVEVRGPDRFDFLQRMLTQDLRPKPGEEPGASAGFVRRSFWLNKKGRIDADLRVVTLPDRHLLEVDALAASRLVETLSHYVITEDVTIAPLPDVRRMGVHGAEAPGVLGLDLTPGRAVVTRLHDVEVIAYREDATGDAGVELIVPAGEADRLSEALLHAPDSRLRRCGWFAWNIARIEGGTPVYNIDFGPESLPAETGVLHDRVSFTKGCYLGQEIVARMHARGHSKQALVSLVVERVEEGEPALALLPERGAALLAPGPDGAEPAEPAIVGAITSSCLSPMRSGEPIALGAVKQSHASPGTALLAEAGGRTLRAVVQPALPRWSRADGILR